MIPPGRIRDLRVAAELTQTSAARLYGCSQGQWSDMERGRGAGLGLSERTMDRLAAVLGCHLRDLMG